MREIKFKVWDGELKEMIYDGEIDNCESRLDSGNLVIGSFDTNEDWYELKPLQFIGLKDKNEKEIYEGDIVTWFADGIHKKATIKWGIGGWEAHRFDKRGDDMELIFQFQSFIPVTRNGFDGEVIGNIYENPELLGEKKQ